VALKCHCQRIPDPVLADHVVWFYYALRFGTREALSHRLLTMRNFMMFLRSLVCLSLLSATGPTLYADNSPPSRSTPLVTCELPKSAWDERIWPIRIPGTKIERFDVEVISILRNFNPKGDVILIRCQGANLEHTGPVAGMSGSPIYLRDDQGRDRLIGAFAYGWPFMKDPIAGVQPIEYMLTLPRGKDSTLAEASSAAGSRTRANADRESAPVRWALEDSVPTPWSKEPPRIARWLNGAAWRSTRTS